MTTPIGPTRSPFAGNGPNALEDPNYSARLHQNGEAARFRFFGLSCALIYCLAITLSIRGSSLWTDEAFSAWMASHPNLPSLLHSLRIGDSSDLQVASYYLYLFGWVRLFGNSEFALRAANIPFALLFSCALVWTSLAIFRSRWAWLPAGMLPFIWQFASEVRAYMASFACAAACLALLLGFLASDSRARVRRYIWPLLSLALFGSMFHMLFVLSFLPLATIACLGARLRPGLPWREWRLPLMLFALPFLALGAFLAWTFTRHDILYEYPRPGLQRMASVVSEITGFAGFGPNRKFSLDFRRHVTALALGGGALLAGYVAAFVAFLRRPRNSVLVALLAAVAVGSIETLALAIATSKQPDARHLAALVPVFLFLMMGIMAQAGRAALAAALLVAGAWLVADIRVASMQEYQKEDFRAAVMAAISMRNSVGAEIAVAADPVAAAYYGLDVRGETPCYPFVEACGVSLDQVVRTPQRWSHAVPAQYVFTWSSTEALQWLAAQRRPVAVIVPKDRSRTGSAWVSVLAAHPDATRQHIHGFDVVLLRP